jgi:uncharacterized membrane protein
LQSEGNLFQIDNQQRAKRQLGKLEKFRLQQVRTERGRLAVHALLLIYAAVLVYILLGLIFRFNVSADVFFGLAFALLFFTLGQALYEMGIKKAVLFLLITGTVGFLAEVLGTNSGFPFGRYYYTNFLGSKFLGVPVVVPLVWFVIAYLSYSIVAGNVPGSQPNSTGSSLFAKTVLLTALGAVAWDFMIDPMFSSYGYWVWTGQFLPLPELDGIPLTNFVGWFVLVALMIALCLWIISPSRNESRSSLLVRNNNRDSVIAYVMLLFDGVIANYSLGHYAVIGLGLVAMLGFLLLALRRAAKSVKFESPGRVSA